MAARKSSKVNPAVTTIATSLSQPRLTLSKSHVRTTTSTRGGLYLPFAPSSSLAGSLTAPRRTAVISGNVMPIYQAPGVSTMPRLINMTSGGMAEADGSQNTSATIQGLYSTADSGTVTTTSTTTSARPSILRRKPSSTAPAATQSAAAKDTLKLNTASSDGANADKIIYRVRSNTLDNSSVGGSAAAGGALASQAQSVITTTAPSFGIATSERKRPRKQQLTELSDHQDRPGATDKRGAGASAVNERNVSLAPVRNLKLTKRSINVKTEDSLPFDQEDAEGVDGAIEDERQRDKNNNNGTGEEPAGFDLIVAEANEGFPALSSRFRMLGTADTQQGLRPYHYHFPDDLYELSQVALHARGVDENVCAIGEALSSLDMFETALYNFATTPTDPTTATRQLEQHLLDHMKVVGDRYGSVYSERLRNFVNVTKEYFQACQDSSALLDSLHASLSSLRSNLNPYNGPIAEILAEEVEPVTDSEEEFQNNA